MHMRAHARTHTLFITPFANGNLIITLPACSHTLTQLSGLFIIDIPWCLNTGLYMLMKPQSKARLIVLTNP